MQEFHRTYCIYHPSESITNFCKQKTCLMPLCPTCICSHLQLHLKEGKATPQFDNITDSLTTCYREIKSFGQKFEESRINLNSIEKSINESKKNLIQLIYQAKIQVRQIVDFSFGELQKQIEGTIFKQNSALCLHQPQYINAIEKKILEMNSKLREMMSDLKNESSLGTLITYYHEGKAHIQRQQQQIVKQISNNNEYYPITNLNQDSINRIKQSLMQLITLKFNFPSSMKKPQATERQNNLIGNYKQGNSVQQSTQQARSPLTKIPNGQFMSPGAIRNGQKVTSPPGRFAPKSMISSPSPRISMQTLPLLSLMNPAIKQEN